MAPDVMGTRSPDGGDGQALAAAGAGARPSVHPLEISYEADPTTLVQMREAVRAWLTAASVPRSIADDLVLACNEAASNAILHGYRGRRGQPGRYVVRVWFAGADVHAMVRDEGRWRKATVGGGGGRGIPLIRGVVGDVSIATGRFGTEVRMRYARKPPAQAQT